MENQDRLLPLIRLTRSRPNAVAALVRRCSVSESEANAILNLRFRQTNRELVKELRDEIQAAVQ